MMSGVRGRHRKAMVTRPGDRCEHSLIECDPDDGRLIRTDLTAQRLFRTPELRDGALEVLQLIAR